MIKMLKDIKKGAHAKVIQFDKDGNLYMTQLHFNTIRGKFYLSEDKRGVIRKSITGRDAEELVLKTLSLKEPYEQSIQGRGES